MSRGILVVAPYLPWPADFGGAIRIYELIRYLARDQRVILLAPASPAEMDALPHLGRICDVTAVPVNWTFRQPAGWRKRLTQAGSLISRASFVELASAEERFQAVMDRLFMTRDFDLVQYEFPQMTRFRPLHPRPTVLDNHNVEHLLLKRVARTTQSLPQRAFNNVEWRKVLRLEHHAWSSVTVNLATSANDAQTISTITGSETFVVPNGVDVHASASARSTPRRSGRVVFVGAMRHQPNAEGARWYAEQVHPLLLAAVPDATLEIVGADPPPSVAALGSDSISVTGRVERVEPHLAQASVAIVPLHAGGGTRLKILDAFAAGVPVVSTSIGAEGLDVTHGQHLIIADTPRAFADAVICLLNGSEPSTAPAALDFVRTHHDWTDAIGPALVAAHDTAIERFRHVG